MADDLGTSTPRGLRNNNPGNLEDNAWTRSLPGYVGSDGRFAKFATPAAGMAALDANLASYGKKGINTPLSIASTWAPGSEKGNDPNSYGGAIARGLGIGPNDTIDMTDPKMRGIVARTISQVENGAGAVSPYGDLKSAASAFGTKERQNTASAPPSDSSTPPPNGLQGLQTLAILQSLFPQHQFTPVDYNPFSYLPKQGGST